MTNSIFPYIDEQRFDKSTMELINTLKETGYFDFLNKLSDDELWRLILLIMLLNNNTDIWKQKE